MAKYSFHNIAIFDQLQFTFLSACMNYMTGILTLTLNTSMHGKGKEKTIGIS